MAKIYPINIEPRPFEIQKTEIKRKYKMFKIINWKTTLIGFAIVVVKFFGSTLGLTPDLINSIIQLLAALIGMSAADASLSKKI